MPVANDESERLTPSPPFCSSTHRAKASPPTEISDQMKGAMLGKLFVELSDGGITTTEWKVGRVVDVTAITVTAPDGTQQVNKHTAKWRGAVCQRARNCSSGRVVKVGWRCGGGGGSVA